MSVLWTLEELGVPLPDPNSGETAGGGVAVTGYQKLMELGRQVVSAERLFGAGSPQHNKAVAAWTRQQKKMGVR
jgi:hypothetical protein